MVCRAFHHTKKQVAHRAVCSSVLWFIYCYVSPEKKVVEATLIFNLHIKGVILLGIHNFYKLQDLFRQFPVTTHMQTSLSSCYTIRKHPNVLVIT